MFLLTTKIEKSIMIDKKLLQDLGWSEVLIEEVTRVSSYIEKSAVREPPIEDTKFYLTSQSSSSINFTYSDINTNSDLKLK